MDLTTWTIIVLLTAMIWYSRYRTRQKRQLVYIRKFHFHKSIREKLLHKYPHLNDEQLHLVFRALRDFFWMTNRAGRRMVAMPSQVVDDAWHEFILFTRSYQTFCRRALGRFLHHTPTEAMTTPTIAQDGIKRAWRLACAKERINPKTPTRLPLIFAIDGMLNIPNGFAYTLNCQETKSKVGCSGYCASHIGCSSGCSGSSGADGGSSDSGGWFDGGGADCGGGCGGGD